MFNFIVVVHTICPYIFILKYVCLYMCVCVYRSCARVSTIWDFILLLYNTKYVYNFLWWFDIERRIIFPNFPPYIVSCFTLLRAIRVRTKIHSLINEIIYIYIHYIKLRTNILYIHKYYVCICMYMRYFYTHMAYELSMIKFFSQLMCMEHTTHELNKIKRERQRAVSV